MVSVHPGTVNKAFKSFYRQKKVQTPSEAAIKIINLLETLTLEDSGLFLITIKILFLFEMINNYKIKSRVIKNVNGLDIYILENKAKVNTNNVILLLHGFPEISFSYRYIMLLFEKAGYYCIAPDQRGYGQTKSQVIETLNSFSVLNLARDMSCLMKKLNIEKYHLIGHDFGAYVSSYLCL